MDAVPIDELILRLIVDELDPLVPRDAAEWFAAYGEQTADLALPVDRALVGGLHADRLAWAFAGGYQAAAAALFGSASSEPPPVGSTRALFALCATEVGGAHPRAIASTFRRVGDGWRLDGEKTFVTFGAEAGTLGVVARAGLHDDGRPLLRVACLPAGRPGISVLPAPSVPFVPEIGHAALRFDAVAVSDAEMLPGDGYADFLRPFRTIEDTHVYAALLGHAMRMARRGWWPEGTRQALLPWVLAARCVAQADPKAVTTHAALAGLIDAARALVDGLGPPRAPRDPDVEARWLRDRPLLDVAEKARVQRTTAAWWALGSG